MGKENYMYPYPELYPEFRDPELSLNEEKPFDVLLSYPNTERIVSILNDFPEIIEARDVPGRAIKALHWGIENIKQGDCIALITPGNPVAGKMNSEILDAVYGKKFTGRRTEREIEKFFRSALVASEKLTVDKFGWEEARLLNDIEEATGVRSYLLLVNHAVVLLDDIAKNIKKGGLAASLRMSGFGIEADYFPEDILPSPLSLDDKTEAVAGIFAIEQLNRLSSF